MNSIFLINDSNYTQPIKEAHFNLWMVGEQRFLDVGLRLAAGQKIELYLPWTQAQIEDLYPILNSGEVLNAIFNQHLTVTQTTGLGYTTVDRGNGILIDVVKIKNITGTNFTLHNTTNTNTFTKITIEPDMQTPNDSYVRLRARGFGENVFSEIHKGTNSVVNPYRESVEAIDFRINEMRTVTPSDFNKPNLVTPPIEKLHFFLLKGFHETNLLSSPPYFRCRELEDRAWDKYLPAPWTGKEAILAYHWKKDVASTEHYSVLATFGNKRASKRILFLYVVVIVLLNCASNLAYDCINTLNSSNNDNTTQQCSSK